MDIKATPFISIIIPVRNEELYIEKCLNSIINNDYPKNKMEVIVVDGHSIDKTQDLIKKYISNYNFIRLLLNPQKTVPYAMNIGIKKSKGEYIIRMDAHSNYPINYFTKLIYWHQKLNADNVGGIVIAKSLNHSKLSQSILTVLSDKFGVGNSMFRTVNSKEFIKVDTVPFGCYKKEVFNKYGLYNEKLVRGQDIEFNKRIINKGGKIYLIPEIRVDYYAADNYQKLLKKYYNTGKWVVMVAYYTSNVKSLSKRHFVPLIFVLSLFLPLLLVPITMYILFIPILSFTMYLITILLRAIFLKKSNNRIIYILLAFFILHIAYGIGSLSAVLNIILKKNI